ncbi:helix-turn-helix domain-containing protein [Aquirhabdus parva]|uniref:Helix-turn-helix domain-containing protein n=1 Tax=Aquirhabdus parva TaxID=2283318 RepID=A0A345PAU5_9GAMM|nr:helix-turn-helix domain-containing protein [Aquirhabdus parva]AXI04360.1 helix-turn-helix domain-containing protein [Aquirhabdus parva]AXI04404.1 helix-turn-helix domain-containing protein [Aquirhabdus parva]
MSVDATVWAWNVPVFSSSERLVLLALADRAGEENTCWPSAERLEKDTHLDIKTVKKVITDLINRGLIADTGKRKGSTGRVRVLELVGVKNRENYRNEPKSGSVESTQKRNDSKNGMIPNLDFNEPKFGSLNEPKNGSLNEPKFGSQNLTGNLPQNLPRTSTFSQAKNLRFLEGSVGGKAEAQHHPPPIFLTAGNKYTLKEMREKVSIDIDEYFINDNLLKNKDFTETLAELHLLAIKDPQHFRNIYRLNPPEGMTT